MRSYILFVIEIFSSKRLAITKIEVESKVATGYSKANAVSHVKDKVTLASTATYGKYDLDLTRWTMRCKKNKHLIGIALHTTEHKIMDWLA